MIDSTFKGYLFVGLITGRAAVVVWARPRVHLERCNACNKELDGSRQRRSFEKEFG